MHKCDKHDKKPINMREKSSTLEFLVLEEEEKFFHRNCQLAGIGNTWSNIFLIVFCGFNDLEEILGDAQSVKCEEKPIYLFLKKAKNFPIPDPLI